MKIEKKGKDYFILFFRVSLLLLVLYGFLIGIRTVYEGKIILAHSVIFSGPQVRLGGCALTILGLVAFFNLTKKIKSSQLENSLEDSSDPKG